LCREKLNIAVFGDIEYTRRLIVHGKKDATKADQIDLLEKLLSTGVALVLISFAPGNYAGSLLGVTDK
jgi:hypothetical protein